MLNPKFNLYKTEWLDLVFADRNKTYGAYDLRSHYGDNMLKALAITMVGFTVAAVSFTIAFKHDKVEPTVVVQVVPDIPIAPIIEKPKKEEPIKAVERPKTKNVDVPKTEAPQVNVKTQEFTTPKMTDQPVTTDIPKLDPNVTISNTTNAGDPNKPSTGILDEGNKPGTEKPGLDKGVDNTPHDIGGLDVMPEPVGGNAAWAKFLQKNLRYPDTEMQGRVIISFIIEKDGHLTDLKIVKGVATELDREAMRVLKLAPAWKPGLQNGQPVRVKYTIPIIFQMNE
jgi:protein TonB